MTIKPKSSSEKCKICGEELSENLKNCSTCKSDAGAPNVRACQKPICVETLNLRFETAKNFATKNKYSKIFDLFKIEIDKKSGVVISAPADVIMSFFKDPKKIYVNYEKLVGNNSRKPAFSNDDQHRFAVGGKLFGCYANEIIYGALSLTDEGVPTYGQVFCRLKSNTIEKRTSFLETNSYKFIEEHKITAGKEIPIGFMSDWENKSKLTLAKLGNKIGLNDTDIEWQNILIFSDGKNRSDDDFIEAYIFESFDSKAINSLKLNKSIKVDIMFFKIANSIFKKNNKGGPI